MDLLRHVFENPGYEMDKLKEVSSFHDGDWNVDDLVRERRLVRNMSTSRSGANSEEPSTEIGGRTNNGRHGSQPNWSTN